MDLQLTKRSVIVTGGGSNIGRAISLRLPAKVSHLRSPTLTSSKRRELLLKPCSLARKSADAIETDVTSWESVQAMVSTVEAKLGKVDVLVNNVGWTNDRLFVENLDRSGSERFN